ncbi:MAG: tRNA (guanosine(37)-N1)-methyltransferase TrmD [Candidatus Omnitrophica bacterium]|nr:tRNA (guanosine(37)-N1)-methyltransferase TrmD [Candidatus Omnitrophota bacterium]
MKLEIDIVTLFPRFFDGPLQESILNRAQQKQHVKIRVHDLRKYTHDRHKTADDKPFGGGAGMVMKPEPIFECVEDIRKKGWVVLLDPQGERMTQRMAARLARKRHIIFIAGHYEGVDHRVKEHLVDQEISVGDFVTMGGEAPAVCILEAVIRLLPGVLGNKDSLVHESFQSGLLEYPQYTRPRNFRGWKVPDILMSGNHCEVEKWRSRIARQLTQKKRPDLLKLSQKRKT